MKLRVLDHQTLVALNRSSIRAGRSQNLRAEQIPTRPHDHYWINAHTVRERDGQQVVRVCVVLDLRSGETAWLDVSPEEFARIPEIEVSEFVWEAVMCTGNPPAPL
jgi:hypothetical protein